MSQDVRPNSVMNNEPIPDASCFSPTAYADRLLDEVFQSVEELLNVETSTDLVTQPTAMAQAGTSIEPVPTAPPPAQEPVGELALPPARLEAQPMAQLGVAVMEPPTVETTSPAVAATDSRSPNAYDRLLLGLGCLSVILALGGWLLYQETNRQSVVMVPPPTPTNPAIASNQDFADYVQKSLQNIDQQTQTSGTTTQLPSENGTPLATVKIPKTLTPGTLGASRTTAGLERIYVPVYQIPPNLYPPGKAVAPLPNIPGVTRTQPPVPGATKSGPATTALAPTVSRKLVGVLDQGAGSVALFEVNGVTQRYGIGESIGSSGWTLVEVTKDQAVVRRNGEVRSLFVGHSF